MVSELEKQINRQLLYRRLRWLGIIMSLAVAGLAIMLLVGGCYSTPSERDAVRKMPEATAQERAAKKLAWEALDLRDADEDSYWTWGTIAATVLGLGGIAERAWAARKASVACDVLVEDAGEALNLLPETTRSSQIQRMKVRQESKGVRGIIRKKVQKQKARGKL